MYWRKQLLMAKIESAYGTDSTPAAATDAVDASDVTVNPLEGQDLERPTLRPYLGARPSEPAGEYVTLTFAIDWQGSGTAGLAPAYDALLRACALAMTETADTDVVWDPVSDGGSHEAVTIKWNADGNQHVLRGARGTVQLVFEAKNYAKLRFTFTGLYTTPSAVALATPTLTSWIAPLKISPAATTFSFFGASRVLQRLEINLGNAVAARHLVNFEEVLVGDRVVTGTAVIEAVALGTFNPFDKAHPDANGDPQTGALSIVHGTVEGRIVSVAAPAVQIMRNITYGQDSGKILWNIPIKFLPDAGDDEIQLKAA